MGGIIILTFRTTSLVAGDMAGISPDIGGNLNFCLSCVVLGVV